MCHDNAYQCIQSLPIERMENSDSTHSTLEACSPQRLAVASSDIPFIAHPQGFFGPLFTPRQTFEPMAKFLPL